MSGTVGDPVDGVSRLLFELPMALPPDGDYAADVDGAPMTLRLAGGDAYLIGPVANRRVTVILDGA